MRAERRFFLALLVLLVVFPLATRALGYQLWVLSVSVGSYALIYLIAAQALNVQVGFTGLLQLGAVAFVGVGAYTGALLLTVRDAGGGLALIGFWRDLLPQLSGQWRVVLFFLDPNFLAYLTVIPAAILAAALLSLLLGIPTLRLTGDYFAIVTLGFAQIFYLVVKNEEWLTYGAAGVKDIPALFSFCTGPDKIEFFDKTAHYLLGVAVFALCLYVVVRMRGSRLGRAFTAVRDDELCAQSHGVSVARYKIGSFVLFSSLAALAGIVLIARNKLISPNDLLFWESILYLCAVVLGGMGSVRGAVVGGLVIGTLGELMRLSMPDAIPSQVRYVLFGAIMIVVMRFKPNGLMPMTREVQARGEEGVGRHREASSELFELRRPR